MAGAGGTLNDERSIKLSHNTLVHLRDLNDEMMNDK